MLFRILVALWLCFSNTTSYAFLAKPVLTVYTYDSFPSKWGPGPKLKPEFEAFCDCELRFLPVADGAALLTRLKVEGKSTKADVALGLDSTMTSEAKSLGLFQPYKPNVEIKLPAAIDDLDIFTAFDYGWFSFIFDSRKFPTQINEKSWPTTMDTFLSSSSFRSRVILEDPRTSGPGLGLLLWLHALYGDKAAEKIALLKNLALTVAPGWSDAYGMFTKGEAPLVFSYTTSQAYHIDQEQVTHFKFLPFTDGHYLQVEVAGVLKSSKNAGLAKKFIDFLLTPKSQSIIASANWMYPVTVEKTTLPKPYETLLKPSKTLYIRSSEVAKNRKKWTDEWINIFKN